MTDHVNISVDDQLRDWYEREQLRTKTDVIATYDTNELYVAVLSLDLGETWGIFWCDGPRHDYEESPDQKSALQDFARDIIERTQHEDK